MHSSLAKRTVWTRLADLFFNLGKHGPLCWRLWAQCDLHAWAMKRVKRQWYNGRYWVDRV